MNEDVEILDATLRDGSYVVDFSFTTHDTELICRRLEEMGLRYIEVGHGLGLNASQSGFGRAPHPDAKYMEAAQEAVDDAEYGMFCIPGIAELEHLDAAHEHDMGFVRIGTNVTEVGDAEPFVERAKDYGMFVAANFMKSYVVEPERFARRAEQAAEFGADLVYIVDSAGGMFPSEIREYYEAVRERTDVPLGFHGHDNLGMAIANSLEAVDLGMEFVDASIQGLGRSAGNAATETLVAALEKQGTETGIDWLSLLDLGRTVVQPLLSNAGDLPLDVVSGYADFHSSYMHHIKRAAAEHGVDPALLILEQCKKDKVNIDPDVLDTLAKDIAEEQEVHLGKYAFHEYGRAKDTRPGT